MGIFHEFALEGGEVAQRGESGKNFAAGVVEDDEAEAGEGHLGQDPRGGEVVEGGEVADEGPGFGGVGGETEKGGEVAFDAVGTAEGTGVVGAMARGGEVPLADGEAVARKDEGARGNQGGAVVDEGGF